MLKMSLIILIGILVVSADKDAKSIETISDISKEAKLENSKIVKIKMKPNLPMDIGRAVIDHSAELKPVDDDKLIYVEVRTGELPVSTIDSDLSDLSTEIDVNTRRFLTDNDSGTDENKEEYRFAGQKTLTMDEVEREADNDQHDDNHPMVLSNKKIDHSDQHTIMDIIGREAIENVYEPSSAAESITGETESHGESTETPTRRKNHYNSSVLKRPETREEPVTSDKSDYDIEIVRQGSEIIEEEDIEVVKSIPNENTRRSFDDFEDDPDIGIFDEDPIQTAKLRENLHDILIDTKSRSGIPHHGFNVPGNTFHFSDPNTNDYHYAKAVDYQSHGIKNINGHQPQHKPLVDHQHHHRPILSVYQPYTNKHVDDNHHNIKPTSYPYQSQNIPLAYELQEPNTLGGYLPYGNLLIPIYRSYNIKSSFGYQSDVKKPFDGYKRFYDLKPNIGFQPHITFPPRPHQIKSITDYHAHNKNIHRLQDVNPFNGHQLKVPTGNYPPQFDYSNSIHQYLPFITKSHKCNIVHGINHMNTSHQPHTKRPFANQPYNIKPVFGFQPYETKPLGDDRRYNQPVAFQTLAGYKPHVTPTTGYQSHVKSSYQSPNIRIVSNQSPNIYTANAWNTSTVNYQSPNTPLTGFQPYNRNNITNEQLNVKSLLNHHQHSNKAIFDNSRLLDSRLVAYHTQDTSRLVSDSPSLHPRNEHTYHPVYGNHHHYVHQNLQPNSPMIAVTPIPIGLTRELKEKRCKTGMCYSINGNLGSTAVNIVNPLKYANGIHWSGLHDGINFNANLGFFRNTVPYRPNSRIILNSLQYPKHVVSARSVDTDRSTEERDADYEDEVDDEGNSNNYPYISRQDQSFNMYNYEATKSNSPLEPLSLDSNIYRPTTSLDNYYSKKSISLGRAENLHNNLVDAIDSNSNFPNTKWSKNLFEPFGPNNAFHTRGRNNSPYEFGGSNNGQYEPRGLNNNIRGPHNNPYEIRNLGNNPYELIGLRNNHHESNIRPFEPYMTLPAMFRRSL